MPTKAKLADVWWMSATLTPVTVCEPGEGNRCYLSQGRSGLTAAEAKRHALDHPGHVVHRESITRTTYQLDGAS
jgi:hypothetical protein